MSPEELSQKAVKPGELAMNCRSLAHELALDSRIDRERLSGPAWRRRSIRLLHNRRTRGNERYPRPGGGAATAAMMCRHNARSGRSQMRCTISAATTHNIAKFTKATTLATSGDPSVLANAIKASRRCAKNLPLPKECPEKKRVREVKRVGQIAQPRRPETGEAPPSGSPKNASARRSGLINPDWVKAMSTVVHRWCRISPVLVSNALSRSMTT